MKEIQTMPDRIPVDEEGHAERRVFKLNDEQWSAFMSALGAPPRKHPRMTRLLLEKSVFE